ncbi:uroporphyrinogen-III synthase [Pseudomonas cremoricolorata]|uniref:Uroporphyrinogen-III synthase n=1 Tax=Pseudomonas cremoricolorata TaxID=157783 RepID=A0A089WR80_9PSED|nr:uroporphyrinogen-III synthase [Pseudomonas cremoricolorata]AIR89012.1 uroporphyrinogen-III synthase [Pseudomonas cremoricolorata]
MSRWRLLLTRSGEDCAAVAQYLAHADITASCLPLIDIQPLALDALMLQRLRELEGYQAFIVVSKPAARLLLDHLAALDQVPPAASWFTVGEATARVLQVQAMQVDWPARGDDSEALLALPALQRVLAAQPRILIVRGVGGRELLAERLAEQGASVDYLELYRRCLPDHAPGTLLGLIDGERLNGLVVSSGQGLEHLHRLAAAQWPRLATMPLFVPSPRVAGQARALGAQQVVECRGANAAALLAAVQRTAVPALSGC